MYSARVLGRDEAIGLAGTVSDLVNKCLVVENEEWWSPWSPRSAAVYLKSMYDKEEGVLVLVERGSEPVGYGFIHFRGIEAFLGWCTPFVQDRHSLEKLLSTTRRVLLDRRIASIEAGCGKAFGARCKLLQDTSYWVDYDLGGVVMVYSGEEPDVNPPRGYEFKYTGLDSVRDIIKKIYAPALGDEYEEGDEEKYLEYLDSIKDDVDIKVITAFSEKGEPAGFVIYYGYKSVNGVDAGYLELLMVHPNHRRRGLGRALLLDATRRLLERERQVYLVAATRWNEWLPVFYHRLGFRVVHQYLSLQTHPLMLPR